MTFAAASCRAPGVKDCCYPIRRSVISVAAPRVENGAPGTPLQISWASPRVENGAPTGRPYKFHQAVQSENQPQIFADNTDQRETLLPLEAKSNLIRVIREDLWLSFFRRYWTLGLGL